MTIAFRRGRRLMLALTALLLTACSGGGGSGGGSSGNTTPNSPPTTPLSAPPVPVANYVGATDPADIDADNAGAMIDAMIISALTILAVGQIDSSGGLPDEIDEEIDGPDGGVAIATGRINPDGSGWLSYDLRDYTDGDVVENGIDTVEWLQTDTQQTLLERRSFDAYRISSPSFGTIRLDGHVERRRPPSGETNYSGSLSYRNIAAGPLELFADDFQLSRESIPVSGIGGTFETSGTGRFYDARFGYVDMQFESPWRTRSDMNLPHHGGPLLGFGADGRFVRAASLTDDEASLGFVEAGATEGTHIARVPWDFSFELATTLPIAAPPVASAGTSKYHYIGREVTQDPSFSSHPDFAWLTFDWELLFKPPGSTAMLSDPTAVKPRLTLDKLGRYLLRVTASDGVNEVQDYAVLTVDDNLSFDNDTKLNVHLPPDTVISQGDTLTVDKTQYTPQDFVTQDPRIEIDFRTGPAARLQRTSEDDEQETFTAIGPGIMLLHVEQTISTALDQMWVAIDSTFHYAPAVYFIPEKPTQSLAVADLNNDGRDDIITTYRELAVFPDSEVGVYLSQAPNTFSDRITLPGGGGARVAVGDVTGDGRPDIVGANDPGIAVFAQQSDGSFAAPVTLAGSTCLWTEGCPLLVGDVNADNRDDVITAGDDGAINVYLQNSGGGLAAPVTIDLDGNGNETINATIGDLNGDGVNDIAVGISLQPQNNLAILYGVANDVPDDPAYLGPASLTFKTPVVAVADLNNDSRDDLVYAYEPEGGQAMVMTYLQNAAGQLEQHQAFSVDNIVLGLQLLDFDRDGRVDIGKVDEGGATGVHYQQDNGMFGPDHREQYSNTARPHAVGDINGDGLADIVTNGFAIEIVFGAER